MSIATKTQGDTASRERNHKFFCGYIKPQVQINRAAPRSGQLIICFNIRKKRETD